jgi:orotidine-5'-phosphate decarboxylase
MKDSVVKDRLILALDVPTTAEARKLVATLRDHVGMFKVGSQLFTAGGPDFVRELVGSGARVFLDLKFHDIPNTVAAASVAASRLGVSILNLHALGGSEMMRRTAAAVSETAEREGLARPAIIAVTVLTSADASTLAEVGIAPDPQARAVALARLADDCGLDGVVASPHEIRPLRAAIARRDFLIVTPGVRPQSATRDDQKRVMTPGEATRAGADYLVIGRAIINQPDPVRAAQRILDEMEAASRSADSPRETTA